MISDHDSQEPQQTAPEAAQAWSDSLLAAFLDGHQSPEQIAADHGLSIDELFDHYESEPFKAALARRESFAIARGRAIIADAYPDALQVLAETARDPDSPTYARRNSAHTITRIAHGAALPTLRSPRFHANPRAAASAETVPLTGESSSRSVPHASPPIAPLGSADEQSPSPSAVTMPHAAPPLAAAPQPQSRHSASAVERDPASGHRLESRATHSGDHFEQNALPETPAPTSIPARREEIGEGLGSAGDDSPPTHSPRSQTEPHTHQSVAASNFDSEPTSQARRDQTQLNDSPRRDPAPSPRAPPTQAAA